MRRLVASPSSAVKSAHIGVSTDAAGAAGGKFQKNKKMKTKPIRCDFDDFTDDHELTDLLSTAAANGHWSSIRVVISGWPLARDHNGCRRWKRNVQIAALRQAGLVVVEKVSEVRPGQKLIVAVNAYANVRWKYKPTGGMKILDAVKRRAADIGQVNKVIVRMEVLARELSTLGRPVEGLLPPSIPNLPGFENLP